MVLKLYNRLARVPGGRQVFSVGFARRAPYFRSIRPRFIHVTPNYAALVLRNRRAVHNHIGTVHAIAVCNGLEAAMGALAEATIRTGSGGCPRAWRSPTSPRRPAT